MKISTVKPGVWITLGFILFSMVVFHVLLSPDRILFTTDDNIGVMASREVLIPHGFTGAWNDSALAGTSRPLFVNWTNLLLWVLPLHFFMNWIHAIDLMLAAVFFAFFLRLRRLHWLACAAGALTAFWLGSNFTLTYAGHIGKFGVLMFAALYLWLSELAVQRRRVSLAVLAGAAMGAMFLEQADVALFFALVLGPYTVYRLWRREGRTPTAWARILAPLLVMALLMAFHPLWEGYRQNIRGVASVDQNDPQEQWAFVTQWSWPPEESIDFIAPGFMGWRSGEPEGPYWGRMGRSAEWAETGQGFRNFKLESQYLGAVPLILAAWALFVAWKRRREARPYAADMLFWGCMLLLTLLLSFGKYFPLYRLFYLLPMVSSIRNPNKFLQVFQVVLGVVTAYGLDTLLGSVRADIREQISRRSLRTFIGCVAGLGGILLLTALFSAAGSGGAVERLAAQGWNQVASSIVDTRITALVWGGVMTLLCAGLLWALLRPEASRPTVRTSLAAVLLLLMAADVLLLANRYIQTMDNNLIKENAVVKLLKSRMGYQRAACISQSGFYNQWLTYLFPYHDIDTVNVTQMPRMPVDYEQFLAHVGRNLPRMWQLMAAQYILSPAQVWGQIQQDPNLKDAFEVVYAYNIFPSGDGGVMVSAGTSTQPGKECILNYRQTENRYRLKAGWRIADDEQALKKLADPAYDPREQVLVASADADKLPSPSSTNTGNAGEVKVKSYRAGRVQLQTSSDRPAVLRVAERYTPDWKAYIDDREVPVIRCDYLFCGVHMSPGLHKVVVAYQPPAGTLWLQLAAMAVCLVCIILLFGKRTATDPEAGDE